MCQWSVDQVWESTGLYKWLGFPGRASGKETDWQCEETQVQSLGWEDPLKKGTATHSSILAWRIPWTEEPGRLQSWGSQRVGRGWSSWARMWWHGKPDLFIVPCDLFNGLWRVVHCDGYKHQILKVCFEFKWWSPGWNEAKVGINRVILVCWNSCF